MSAGLHSLLVPARCSFDAAAECASCWIDSLPNISDTEALIIQDYLASECKIELPCALPSDTLFHFRAVTSLTLHAAKCLRTRLQKKVRNTELHDILRLYGRSADGGDEWLQYLCRQSRNFPTDDCRIVLLTSVAYTLDDDVSAVVQ